MTMQASELKDLLEKHNTRAIGACEYGIGSLNHYVTMQGRVVHTIGFRIQGPKSPGNPFEIDLSAFPPTFTDWFNGKVPHTRTSLVGSKAAYATVLVKVQSASDSSVRVQIPGGKEYNRPYGACLILKSEALYNYYQLVAKNCAAKEKTNG